MLSHSLHLKSKNKALEDKWNKHL